MVAARLRRLTRLLSRRRYSLLRRKFFHRAKKMAISDRDLRRKQLKKLKKLEEEEKRRVAGRTGGDSEAEERRAEERRAEERSAAEDTGAERSAAEGDAPRKVR